MTNSEKLLALYDEIIVNRYIDEKNAMQEWHDTYKEFMESVQNRITRLKNGEKLNYDTNDVHFLDELFVSSNPVSSRGSNPIPDEVLKSILRNKEFIGVIEEAMLNPNRESWDNLTKKGKSIFKTNQLDNQPLRFNRIIASCSNSLIPLPSEGAFKKLVKYLSDNTILDFTNIEKNWYAQNEYLTKEIHEIFSNKILDENDFTDEYWLNLFAWSLYDKKANQSESDVENTKTKPNTGTKKMENSLNRILFGAAGTGKTYCTINHALSIIENKPLEVLEQEDRTALKTRFDQYKEQGQIKFVTFHQSFSYEDFVEGIRAESQKNELGKSEITYPIASGVFKNICSLASEGEFDSTTSNYEELINIVVDNLLNKLKNDELVVLQTKTGKKFSLHQGSGDKNIVYRTTSGYSNSISIRSVKKELMLELEERKTYPVYEPKLVEALQEDIKKIMRKQNPLKSPYVLIIDEINRGNISRIFGELITLIEDSKRQGAEEELSVTLPYSKKEFSVPSNVYIIGTMNSSDRSLTGLDIALRRRFTFIEMPSKPDLLNDVVIEDLNVGKLLKVINQRIEVLLDRDHCIGHANFMSLKEQPTLEHLAVIFKQKIIPQLQEYFFDDWSKINMVLNANGMFKAQTVERSVLFPNVDTESEGVFEDQKTWQIVEKAFESIDSFAKIIKH